MADIINILSQALQSTPASIIPFIMTLAVVAYLSFRAYQEFKSLYKKVNTDKFEMTDRIAKLETKMTMSDEKTLMLSQKLERIEDSLEKMNNTLIELSTTLRMMREEKIKK